MFLSESNHSGGRSVQKYNYQNPVVEEIVSTVAIDNVKMLLRLSDAFKTIF